MIAGRSRFTAARVGVLPDAGPAVDLLDQDGAGQQGGESKTADGDDLDQSGPQHMAPQHDPAGQALGGRGRDVVLVENLQHRRADEPDQRRDRQARQYEHRQCQVPDGVPEHRRSAGEQGVDGVHAGDVRRRGVLRAEPASVGRDAEQVEEHVEHHDREPEGRCGQPDQRARPDRVVGGAVLADRGPQPHRDADDQREQHRRHGELQAGRNVLRQVGQHRVAGALGSAQVTVGQVSQVGEVLRDERLVQAPFRPIGRDDRRIVLRGFGEVGRGRVAGHQLNEKERQHRHAQQQTDGDQELASEEPGKGASGATPRTSACVRRRNRIRWFRTRLRARGGAGQFPMEAMSTVHPAAV